MRDGRWTEEDASVLVPGDIISIKLGDIIPADARLMDGDPLKIDQVSVSSWFLVLDLSMLDMLLYIRFTESLSCGYAVGSDR